MAEKTTVQSWKKQNRRSLIYKYIVLIIIFLIIVIPIVMLIFGALKTRGELATMPYTPPIPPHFENIQKILNQPDFWNMLKNSLFVMLVVTAGTVLVAAMAAFAFSRLNFRGKSLSFNLVTLGLLFPMSIAILPEYILLRQLNLLNLWGIILPEIAFALAGDILILRGFFMAIPIELQDAAYIDGCSNLGFFWKILLPLARPSLSAVAVLAMINSWNELFLPIVILNDEKLYTLPLGTMQFSTEHGTDWAMVLAFVALSMIPTIIFYLFAEKQLISGLTAGAVKG